MSISWDPLPIPCPLDNDVAGADKSGKDDAVRVENATLSYLSFSCPTSAKQRHRLEPGSMMRASLPTPSFLRRDGEVLQSGGVNYRFDYQATTDQIVLTPQAGIWLAGFTYEIEVVNQDRFVDCRQAIGGRW